MRLIDADALGIGLASSDVFSVPEYADGWNNAIKIIMAAPTVDAAPIVQYEYCMSGGQYDEQGFWIPSDEGLGMAHVVDEFNRLMDGKARIEY